MLRPAGTYFANVDCKRDGAAFCRELVERAGVVAIPTSVFYDDEEAGRSLVRFAFCKRADVIDEAARRLALRPAELRRAAVLEHQHGHVVAALAVAEGLQPRA